MSREKIMDYFFMGLIWTATYFSPVLLSLLLVGFFIVSDAITGILASKSRGEEFNSKKLRISVSKFAAYGIGVIVAYVMEKLFLYNFPAMKLVTGLIAFIELKSINENIEIVTNLNMFKSMAEKFYSFDKTPKKERKHDNTKS